MTRTGFALLASCSKLAVMGAGGMTATRRSMRGGSWIGALCLGVPDRGGDGGPADRSKFSKHMFTQPPLLTLLCLMRYEDWTFREVEVRLAEHAALRKALSLQQVPDYTTVSRFLRQLDDATLQRVLTAVVRRLPRRRGKTVLAIDGTGLTPGAVGTFFVKRLHDQGGTWRRWCKWLIAVDVPRRALLAQRARQGPTNDSVTLRPVAADASAVVPVGAVVADAECDRERNHRFIRDTLGAKSAIPATQGKPTWRIHGIRAQMRRHFSRALYRQRTLVESVIAAAKRKLSDRAPGRSPRTQHLQALVLSLAYDVYRLKCRCHRVVV